MGASSVVMPDIVSILYNILNSGQDDDSRFPR